MEDKDKTKKLEKKLEGLEKEIKKPEKKPEIISFLVKQLTLKTIIRDSKNRLHHGILKLVREYEKENENETERYKWKVSVTATNAEFYVSDLIDSVDTKSVVLINLKTKLVWKNIEMVMDEVVKLI